MSVVFGTMAMQSVKRQTFSVTVLPSEPSAVIGSVEVSFCASLTWSFAVLRKRCWREKSKRQRGTKSWKLLGMKLPTAYRQRLDLRSFGGIFNGPERLSGKPIPEIIGREGGVAEIFWELRRRWTSPKTKSMTRP